MAKMGLVMFGCAAWDVQTIKHTHVETLGGGMRNCKYIAKRHTDCKIRGSIRGVQLADEDTTNPIEWTSNRIQQRVSLFWENQMVELHVFAINHQP